MLLQMGSVAFSFVPFVLHGPAGLCTSLKAHLNSNIGQARDSMHLQPKNGWRASSVLQLQTVSLLLSLVKQHAAKTNLLNICFTVDSRQPGD